MNEPITFNIAGVRIGGGGGTADHSQLTNRDAEDQHPMSAITGLTDAVIPNDESILELMDFAGLTNPIADGDGALFVTADDKIYVF